jgi:hypothetical protein
VTITKDDLRNGTKRDTLRRIAHAVEFFTISYNAIPAYEQNERDRERCLDALLKELHDMVKEIENA